jgi:hypothetical protein
MTARLSTESAANAALSCQSTVKSRHDMAAMRTARHCEERQRRSNPALLVALDCFAELVIGRRFAPTRWLAMTGP